MLPVINDARMGTKDEMSHSQLLALDFDRLLTMVVLLARQAGSLFILPLA